MPQEITWRRIKGITTEGKSETESGRRMLSLQKSVFLWKEDYTETQCKTDPILRPLCHFKRPQYWISVSLSRNNLIPSSFSSMCHSSERQRICQCLDSRGKGEWMRKTSRGWRKEEWDRRRRERGRLSKKDVTHFSFGGESQFKKYTDRNKNGEDGCKHSKASRMVADRKIKSQKETSRRSTSF